MRANIFHFREGIASPQDYYLDVADIAVAGGVWTTRDLYIDLICRTGNPVEVVDIDELAVAASVGFITPEEAEHTIEATLHAVEGITRNGDDAMAWLRTLGIELTWSDKVTLAPRT